MTVPPPAREGTAPTGRGQRANHHDVSVSTRTEAQDAGPEDLPPTSPGTPPTRDRTGPATPPDPATPPHPATPPARGLPRAVVLLLGVAGAVVALAGAQAAASVLAPTFLAVTLVITISPMQRWLLARRVPAVLVIVVSVLVLYGLVLALVGALVLSLVQLLGVLPDYFDQLQALYTDGVTRLDQMGVSGKTISTAVSQINPSSIFGYATSFLQQLLAGLGSVTSLVVLLLTVILFLAADAISAPRRLALVSASHPQIAVAMASFASGVRRYWLVTTVFGAAVAALDVVALLWLGVPLALTWGLFAFITNFIPNVGFFIGVVPPALIALLEGGPSLALTVLAVYVVLNVVIQTVIQPRFVGDAVGLTSAGAFLSLIFWGFVLGPLGALLAIPATSFVKAVLVDADPSARWVDAIVSSTPEGPERSRRHRHDDQDVREDHEEHGAQGRGPVEPGGPDAGHGRPLPSLERGS